MSRMHRLGERPSGGAADAVRRSWRFLVLLSLVSAALLAFKIGDQSLWLDEDMGVIVAQGSWEAMWRFFLEMPAQHPLYYPLLRAWTVFGVSEPAVRSLSAVFTVASLWALYALASQLVGERVAKLSAIAFCVSPYSLYLGQEARMYSMLGLLTIVSALLFLRCLGDPSRRSIVGYVVVAVLGAYTHLFFVFALAAHFFYLVIRHRSERALFWRLFAAQAVAVACYLPWAVLTVTHTDAGQTWKGAANVIFGIPYALLRFSVGYSVFAANYRWKEHAPELLASNWLVLSVTAICCGVLTVLGFRYMIRRGANALFVALGLVVPMIIALVASLVTVLIGDRYLMVSFPFYVIILASGIAEAWESRGRLGVMGKALVTGYASVVGLALYNHYFNPEFGKEQWADVAHLIRASASPTDLVVLRNGYIASSLLRYYHAPPGQQIHKSEELSLDSVRAAPRVWLVLAHAPDAESYASKLATTHPIRREWLFPHQSGIRVILLVRAGPST
jgi:4-amino-4-deoxy-L-arabinose transferase-like glycosyltransferase